MSPAITEISVHFTIPSIANLDDATKKAYVRLTELGITEDTHTFTIVVAINEDERIISSDGNVVQYVWEADISVKGRAK